MFHSNNITKCLSLLLSALGLILVFFFPSMVLADTIVNLPEPVGIPAGVVTINGTGNPGAAVGLVVYSGRAVIFTTSTTVNLLGSWQITIPASANSSVTRIVVSYQTTLPWQTIVEATIVTTIVMGSSLVLLQLIAERGFRLFQLLGFFRKQKTRGFVFDVVTKKPVAFAILTIESLESAVNILKPRLRETVVSNVDGFFKTVSLPAGFYRIIATHPDYIFPVVTVPWYINSPLEFYQGQTIELSNQDEFDLMLIPLQPKIFNKKKFSRLAIANIKKIIFNLFAKLTIPAAVLSILVAIIFPSFLNFALASVYIVLGIYELIRLKQTKRIKGVVFDEKGKAVENAFVKILSLSGVELKAVGITNNNGKFSFSLPKDQYQIIVGKDGYLPNDLGLVLTTIELDRNKTNLIYRLGEVSLS